MPKLSLWNARKGNTYKFIDKKVSQQFMIGGTAFLIHKYVGPVTITDSQDATIPNYEALGGVSELTIQDVFFLENRDSLFSEESQPSFWTIQAMITSIMARTDDKVRILFRLFHGPSN